MDIANIDFEQTGTETIQLRDEALETTADIVRSAKFVRHTRSWGRGILDLTDFEHLLAKWNMEKKVMSSISDITTCPSYRKIIAMGERAVPLILRQLDLEKNKPNFWIHALKEITGENPVPESAHGSPSKIVQSWLSWGKRKGVL